MQDYKLATESILRMKASFLKSDYCNVVDQCIAKQWLGKQPQQ
jgi:hypothetical protein